MPAFAPEAGSLYAGILDRLNLVFTGNTSNPAAFTVYETPLPNVIALVSDNCDVAGFPLAAATAMGAWWSTHGNKVRSEFGAVASHSVLAAAMYLAGECFSAGIFKVAEPLNLAELAALFSVSAKMVLGNSRCSDILGEWGRAVGIRQRLFVEARLFAVNKEFALFPKLSGTRP